MRALGLGAMGTLLLWASLCGQDGPRVAEAQTVLSTLVEAYGVSGAEGPVRDAVKRLLPAWAQTETDTAGNLWVRVGRGDPLVVFVAHLDEIGFTVTNIRDDGSLELQTRGGFFGSLFEAQPALVHTDKGDVPGVFMPRDSGATRHTPPPLRVDLGTTSRATTLARGVSPGTTVTMPKQFMRLAGTRATGRSFDDRVGCTAQLLALRHLDRAALKHQVVFVFSTREEIGLEGAQGAAAALGTAPRRGHALDTFVSADSPLEPPNFAVAPIGQGAVARGRHNSSITPPAHVRSLLQVAPPRGGKLQNGATHRVHRRHGGYAAPGRRAGPPHRAGHRVPRDDGRAGEDAAPQGARRPTGAARSCRRPRGAPAARHHADRSRGGQSLPVPRHDRATRRDVRAGDRADRHRRPGDAALRSQEPP